MREAPASYQDGQDEEDEKVDEEEDEEVDEEEYDSRIDLTRPPHRSFRSTTVMCNRVEDHRESVRNLCAHVRPAIPVPAMRTRKGGEEGEEVEGGAIVMVCCEMSDGV